MSDVEGALDRMRLAVGETDAPATIAVAWFDGVDSLAPILFSPTASASYSK